MKKSMTGAEAGTVAGITAGVAAGMIAGMSTTVTGLLAREYFFRIALDASTDKSTLLKPAPGTEKEEKMPEGGRNAPETVTMFKAQYEEREVVFFDQLRLHGHLCRREKPNKKWAVSIHGHDDSGMWFGKGALTFCQAGFNLLLPNARSHGKSRDTYVGMGWHDRLDIKEWICWLVGQYPDSEIVLCGIPMGAATVMMTVREKLPSNVEAAVGDYDYTSTQSVLLYWIRSQFHLSAFPFLYCADFVAHIRAGYDMKEADALRCVAGTRLPMFLIHGTEDRFVPFEMMRELYDACRSEKEYLAVADAAHVQAVLVGGAKYWDRVFRFVGRYLERQQAEIQISGD